MKKSHTKDTEGTETEKDRVAFGVEVTHFLEFPPGTRFEFLDSFDAISFVTKVSPFWPVQIHGSVVSVARDKLVSLVSLAKEIGVPDSDLAGKSVEELTLFLTRRFEAFVRSEQE